MQSLRHKQTKTIKTNGKKRRGSVSRASRQHWQGIKRLQLHGTIWSDREPWIIYRTAHTFVCAIVATVKTQPRQFFARVTIQCVEIETTANGRETPNRKFPIDSARREKSGYESKICIENGRTECTNGMGRSAHKRNGPTRKTKKKKPHTVEMQGKKLRCCVQSVTIGSTQWTY